MASYLWKQSNLCVSCVSDPMNLYEIEIYADNTIKTKNNKNVTFCLQRSIGNDLVFERTKHRTEFLLELEDKVEKNHL